MSRQKVRDVMSTDIATVLEGTPFKEVAKTMALWNVSGLPVVDRARHVLGVASEADLLVKQGTQEIEWTRPLLGWWRRRHGLQRADATTAGTLMSKPAASSAARRLNNAAPQDIRASRPSGSVTGSSRSRSRCTSISGEATVNNHGWVLCNEGALVAARSARVMTVDSGTSVMLMGKLLDSAESRVPVSHPSIAPQLPVPTAARFPHW